MRGSTWRSEHLFVLEERLEQGCWVALVPHCVQATLVGNLLRDPALQPHKGTCSADLLQISCSRGLREPAFHNVHAGSDAPQMTLRVRTPLRVPVAAYSSISRGMSAGVLTSGMGLPGCPPSSILIHRRWSRRGCENMSLMQAACSCLTSSAAAPGSQTLSSAGQANWRRSRPSAAVQTASRCRASMRCGRRRLLCCGR